MCFNTLLLLNKFRKRYIFKNFIWSLVNGRVISAKSTLMQCVDDQRDAQFL